MKETKCETVRHELEELMLNEECSMYTKQHLSECVDCSEFHQKQTKLRQIVGSLGTVEAPPDFDFRLRARLANESNSAGYHLRFLQWSFASKSLAAATMILLVVGGLIYLRPIFNQTAHTNLADQRIEPPQAAPEPAGNEQSLENTAPVVASENASRRVVSERREPASKRLVSVDLASERAPVYSDAHRHSAIFQIDAVAPLEPFRVSLDDGRGNERTISVPAITFGSKRVLPTANQVAQKDAGVW